MLKRSKLLKPLFPILDCCTSPLMATTSSLCSLPTQSPTLPSSISLSSLPSLKTHFPQQPHFQFPPFSTKFGSNLINNDALALPTPPDAAALAVEATRERVMVEATEASEAWSCKILERMEESFGSDGTVIWKKKRRKRRKEMKEKGEENWVALSNAPLRSGYLSSKEEAELCLCLKVGFSEIQ